MEGLKAFFGFSNTDTDAKARCKQYLQETVEYGKKLTPVPEIIPTIDEFLASITPDTADAKDSSAPSSEASQETAVEDSDGFWDKWDEFKEDALNILTTKPENQGVLPEGNFVAMWQYLENGRLPHSTAPPETHNRRRSSLARVRLA